MVEIAAKTGIPSDHHRLLDFGSGCSQNGPVDREFKFRLTSPYDDPAPLGGSFVIDFATRTDTPTSDLPIVTAEEIEAASRTTHRSSDHSEAVPPARRSEHRPEHRVAAVELITKDGRTPRSSRSDHRWMMKSLSKTIFDMVDDSLALESPAAWNEFWVSNLTSYSEMRDMIFTLAKRLGDKRVLKPIRVDDDISPSLAACFPDELANLRLASRTVESCVAHAMKFGPVEENLRGQDYEIGRRFKTFANLYSVSMLTLDLVARGAAVQSAEVLDYVFMTVEFAASEFRDATMEAAQLRDPIRRDLQDVIRQIDALEDPDDDGDEEFNKLLDAACEASPGGSGHDEVRAWAARLAVGISKDQH